MTGEDYEHLYKRYLKRDPKELLEMAGMQEGYRVLDLCAGSNGRASKAAVEMGASYVAAVDLNPFVKQLHSKRWSQRKVEPFCEDVFGYVQYNHIPKEERFDIVICQQGINYWLNSDNSHKRRDRLHKIAGVSKRNFKLVFNTFNKMPPEKPLIKEYELDGNNYVEVVWTHNDHVNHIQIVNDLEPHFTTFKWLPREVIEKICDEAHLNIEVKTEGSTDIYVCTRKIMD